MADRRWWKSFGKAGEDDARAKAEDVLAKVGLSDRRDALAGNLSQGEKQWLENGMVVATEAELMLLDEPTAGMVAMESTQTAEIVKPLVGEPAVLVIDQDIDFFAQQIGRANDRTPATIAPLVTSHQLEQKYSTTINQ